MEQLIATIEKGQPFFNAIARNKYLKAIRDGFISVIPIIIFSSIFCLVASVPNIWGFYWPDDINNALWKCYNYSMGILAIACAATTAKHFADAQNRDLPKNNQINFISCMCAAIIGFLLLSSDTIATDAASGFNTTNLGSKGLQTAFIAASFGATPPPRPLPAASPQPTLVPRPVDRLYRCVCDRHHLQVLHQAQHHRQDARAGSAQHLADL